MEEHRHGSAFFRAMVRPARPDSESRSGLDANEVDTPPLLQQLRRRPRLVALGLLIATLVAAARLESITPHSTASTQVALGEGIGLGLSESAKIPDYYTRQLPSRSATLADMIASPEIRGDVAHAASLPASKIDVDAPLWTALLRDQQWPTPQKRASQIVAEGDPYRLTLNNAGDIPLIDVTAQAPSAEAAARLAAAVAPGLNTYLAHFQRGTPSPLRYSAQQVVPVSIAPASGTKNIAIFTFLVVFVLWCACLLGATALIRDLRSAWGEPKVRETRERSLSSDVPPWEPSGVSH